MRMVFFGFLLLMFALTVPLVYADKGVIPVRPEVSVYEPSQKAIVAWNGVEEVLILSTDVVASGETLVLGLLPLPSEPIVEGGSFKSFEELQRLIWREGLRASKGLTRPLAEGIEVVFHERIGAHDVTVVKARDVNELAEWIKGFLKANGVEGVVSLGDFEEALKDYMGKGFKYYALDLTEVTPKEGSVEPILYRFKSSFLYYPLLVTSRVRGETKITLFLLTRGKVEGDYTPLEKAYYQVGEARKPIEFLISKSELSKVDLRIGELFQDGAWLTVLKFEGKTGWLTKDLMISEEDLRPTDTVKVEVTLPLTLIAACILLGAACAIAGSAVTILIIRPRVQ